MGDVGFALCLFRKNPGFALVALLAMSVGIGVNATIFSVFNQTLLRPLPYPNPDRLVFVWETFPTFGLERNTPAPGNFAEWRAQNHVFTDMAAFTFGLSAVFTRTGVTQPERLQGATVTASFFPLLGVKPALGRTLLEDEDREGGPRAVVLGYRLWQRSFSGDRGVLGRTVILNGQSYSVVGVMPAGFAFPSRDTELWVPLALSRAQLVNRGSHYLEVIARLKAGISIEQAAAEMKTVAQRLSLQYPGTNTAVGATVVPIKEQAVGEVKPALVVLLCAVGLVLLISCANVANILLARSIGRQKEMAVRAALGARAGRLVRQMLTESVVLAGAGGLVGLALAYWGIDLLLSLTPRELWLGAGVTPTSITGRIDGSVLLFTGVLSLGTGLLFGLAPALTALRASPNANLKEVSRGQVGFRQNRLRSALVISEVALAVMLLVGAGLLVRSFLVLAGINPGFDSHNVLTVRLTIPATSTHATRIAWRRTAKFFGGSRASLGSNRPG